MGRVSTIDHKKFPKQGDWVGKTVWVFFKRQLEKSKAIQGTIIRHDLELAHRVIIKLSDGRVILDEECLYTVPGESLDGPMQVLQVVGYGSK